MIQQIHRLPWTTLALCALFYCAHPLVAQYTTEHFAQIRGRSIGPAGMSGRVAAVDVVTSDPNIIYVGSATGGVWRSVDGGIEWAPIFDEQPFLGIGAVAVSQATPDVVYALVEAEKSELIRSEDGGRSWETINDRSGVVPGPFYYADLRVDPQNENRIYSLHGSIQVSEDQGRNFETVVSSSTIHGDVHELWIDPDDGRHMIIGNDGGIAFTYDRGNRWRFVENLTLAQFYHISVDNEVPFNVYGGLQDNGSWYGPSTVWENRGIMNAHWRRVGSGDGFAVFADPKDSRYGYSMSQQGNLVRFDKETGRRVTIQPVHPDGEYLRFNWNAALNVDPHDASVLYLGSQFVHRTRDHGNSWEIISPDLTTNDAEKQRQQESGGLTLDATGAENHTTILSISPSPLQPGLIWASTDDGNVQITDDDGATWRNTGVGIRGVPRGTWVPHVEPSHHDAQTAYVVLEDHRRGNWEPYVYKTEDLGQTWNALSTNGIDGFVHVIREDPEEPRLLFLGTEFGLRVSLDGGDSWIHWNHGVPPAPVRDLRIHPRDHDLVVGTHGRGAYVIDDIRPLREAARDSGLADEALRVLPMAPAQKHATAETIGYRSVGHAMMFGEVRPYGALINYWVGVEADGKATIDILDVDGSSVRTLTGPADVGVNRVVWDLRRGGEDGPGGQGAEVLGGTYAVRVTVGDSVSTREVTVLEDVREDIPLTRRIAKLQAVERAQSMTTALSDARRRLERAIRTAETVQESLREREGGEDLRQEGAELQASLEEMRERLFTGPSCQGVCGRSRLPSNAVRRPLRVLGSSPDTPTANERLMLTQAEEALRGVIDEVNAVFDGAVATYSRRLQEAGYSPFPEADPLRIRMEQR